MSELDPGECWHLIDTATLGRLAFSRRALPVVYPVRFTASEGVIWFWLDTPALQRAAMSSDVVCFEVDAWAPSIGGWSVLATGHLRVVTAPWGTTTDPAPAAVDGGCLAQLAPAMVSGRRIDVLEAQGDSRP